jgi:hypothetical protein
MWGDTAVDFQFDIVALNNEPPLVPLAALEKLAGAQDWSNRRCGIGVKPEALKALHGLLGFPASSPENDPTRREMAMAPVRPGQVAFAAAVYARSGGRCVLSGLGNGFSTAAHIVGYTKCATKIEQDDPDNGLYLAGHLHLAFDRHLFGIRPDGTVVWSKGVSPRRT